MLRGRVALGRRKRKSPHRLDGSAGGIPIPMPFLRDRWKASQLKIRNALPRCAMINRPQEMAFSSNRRKADDA